MSRSSYGSPLRKHASMALPELRDGQLSRSSAFIAGNFMNLIACCWKLLMPVVPPDNGLADDTKFTNRFTERKARHFE